MAFTPAEEARIAALEADVALLVQKVENEMVSNTQWRQYNTLIERDIQNLQAAVESLESQVTTLQDLYTQLQAAYADHTTHPPGP